MINYFLQVAVVDFVKIALYGASIKLLSENCHLDFEGRHNVLTGEILGKKIAIYKGLKIIIYSSVYAEIQGSLHKYNNGGEHNHNDFTFSQLEQVLNDLSSSLKIDLHSCFIKNIEFAVNICPPISTKDVLRGLLMYRNQEFKNVSCGKGDYRQVELQRYYIKAYDKALQYDLVKPVFRFELKFIKMIEIQRYGLRTLGDLLTGNWILALHDHLMTVWNDVIFFDKSIYENISKSAKNELKLSQWQNPNFWQQLSKQQRFKEKNKYQEIVKRHSTEVHLELAKLLSEKWKFLSRKGLPINRKFESIKSYFLTP